MKNNDYNKSFESVFLSMVVLIAFIYLCILIGAAEYYFVIEPKKKELKEQIQKNRPKPKKIKGQAPAPWQIYTPEEIINKN